MGILDFLRKKKVNVDSDDDDVFHFSYVFLVRTKIGKNRVDDADWWNAFVRLLERQIPGAIPVPPKAWDNEPYLHPLFGLNASYLKNCVESPGVVTIVKYDEFMKCEDALSKRTDAYGVFDAPSIMRKAVSRYILMHIWDKKLPPDIPLAEAMRRLNPFKGLMDQFDEEGKSISFKNASFNYVPFGEKEGGEISDDVFGIHIKQ